MKEDANIRAAAISDISVMQALEIDAARRYATQTDYEFCARLPPRSHAEHMRVQASGAAWLADVEGRIVGFLLALPVDGRAHVLEAATQFSAQGRGVGRSLFARFHAWAADAGFAHATLTTYRDIPWNAPFYERLGYGVVALDAGRPELAAIRAEEAASGLDRGPRVGMGKRLTRP